MPTRISVCVPAYNEEAVIAETVAEALETFDQLPGQHELLVVDDGSADRTWEIIEALAEQDGRLRVFRHSDNRGLAAAQRTLIGNAQGEYIFHIGADREWRMREMIPMLAALERGYDICIGVRRDKKYSLGRRIASAGFNWSVALLWGEHFGDLGSIKLARASLWKRIPIRSGSAFVNAERVLIARRNGARIVKVPVEHTYRSTGTSKFASPVQSLRALRDLVRLRFAPASLYEIPPESPE
ncbi:MAG TPA: glycosyltransferase family 2 protein [Kofleriaceae bacterium]|nr:glycosyltransferase family 2 protein [Kofleriaceae bacterium]